MADNSNASSGGISLLTVLGVVFIVLKLTHVIDWSWWWVLLPLYGPMVLAIAVLLIVGLVALVLRKK